MKKVFIVKKIWLVLLIPFGINVMGMGPNVTVEIAERNAFGRALKYSLKIGTLECQVSAADYARALCSAGLRNSGKYANDGTWVTVPLVKDRKVTPIPTDEFRANPEVQKVLRSLMGDASPE